MMTTTYLKRPLRLRLRWRLEATYLRWRIKHAELCRSYHQHDLISLRESAEQMSLQIDLDDKFVRELVLRLSRVVSK